MLLFSKPGRQRPPTSHNTGLDLLKLMPSDHGPALLNPKSSMPGFLLCVTSTDHRVSLPFGFFGASPPQGAIRSPITAPLALPDPHTSPGHSVPKCSPPKSHPHRALLPAAPHTGAHRKQDKEDEPPKARPTEAGAAPTGTDAWVEVVESCPISLETSLLPSTLLTSFAELPAGLGRPRGRAPRASGGLQMELEGGRAEPEGTCTHQALGVVFPSPLLC